MINKSKAYIAPLLLNDISDIPFNLIKNTFIFSNFSPLEPLLYVVVSKELEDVKSLYKYEEVEDIFSLGEDSLVVLKLDTRYNYEYLCFKRGNYSWYTAEAKSMIVQYLTNNVNRRSLGIVDKIRSVFARDPMLKRYYENTLGVNLGEEAELGSRIIDEEETFKSDNYGEFTQIKR